MVISLVLDVDWGKLDRNYDDMIEELSMIDQQKLKADYEIIAEDYTRLTKKEFMRKYNITESEYNQISYVMESEDIEETIGEPEKKMDLFWLWTTLGMATIFHSLERESTREHYEENGVKYVNWMTMEDSAVCPICEEYAAQNPWPIDGVPEVPHVGCRCWLEPADEEGNTITDLDDVGYWQMRELERAFEEMI